MSPQKIVYNKWFLHATVLCGFLPYIAVWTGWWTREVGRQPWVVYGMMTTAQGTSRMSIAEEIFWMVGYIIFELLVWGGTWYFFAKVMRQGPDMDSPVVQEGHQPIGHVEPLVARSARHSLLLQIDLTIMGRFAPQPAHRQDMQSWTV